MRRQYYVKACKVRVYLASQIAKNTIIEISEEAKTMEAQNTFSYNDKVEQIEKDILDNVDLFWLHQGLTRHVALRDIFV